MFDSLFKDGILSTADIFISLGVSLVVGIIFTFMCYYKTKSTKGFLVTASLIPFAVTLIIILVNGNIGTGVAIAGAFGLVRFRSAPGTAKEICIIFISMAGGLAFGMGYILYGIIFMIIAGLALMLYSKINIWETKVDSCEKILRVTIPEELDYNEIFDDLFSKYTVKHEVLKVKSINMGSMFKVYYQIKLLDIKMEKSMIDEIRTRNGNLEVSVERIDFEKSEL